MYMYELLKLLTLLCFTFMGENQSAGIIKGDGIEAKKERKCLVMQKNF